MKRRIIFTLLILTVCLIFSGCDVILNMLGNTPSEHTHSFSEEVTRPTPKEKGYTTYTCECGYSYVDNYVDISPSKRLKFEFNSKRDGYELIDLGYCDDVDVVIPATHNMLPVTGISDHAFQGATNVRSVTIPASITSIGDKAFFYCSGLTDIYVDEGNPCYKSIDGSLYSKDGTTLVRYAIGRTSSLVEIPDGVTSIGSFAFATSENLVTITIPEHVTNIDAGAFKYCPNLSRIEVDENNLAYKTIDGNLYSKDGHTLVQYVIKNDNKDFTVPEDVTSIGGYAFSGCKNLTRVSLPSSVTDIGVYAFEYCESLETVTMSENAGSIGKGTFSNCKKLANITIPSGVTGIGDYTFEYCESLETVTMSENVKSIGKGAFSNCKKLANITIPSSVTDIGDYSFEYCLSLAIITIPDSVESIGNHAFGNQENDFIICCETASAPSGWNPNWCAPRAVIVWDCKNNDVAVDGHIYVVKDSVRYVIKDGSATVAEQSKNIAVAIICESITYKGASYPVTSIGYGAFGSCKNLTSVTVPGSVTDIGSSAFSSCDSLTDVTLQDGIISIGSSAFSSCDSLKSITIPNSVTHVGFYAFYFSSDLIIYCEAESKPDGWHSDWCDSSIVVVWSYRTIYVTVDGIRYGINDGVAAVVKQSEDITVAIIPEIISYEGILYPVTSIRDSAFKDCKNLTSVTVPASVTSIGREAFRNCKSLTNVTLTEGIVEIGESAFRYCINLESIIVPNGVITIGDSAFEYCLELKTITLPDSVTSLNSNVFYLCLNLIDIDIPKNVTSIGKGAFRGCQKLTSVNIPDGVTSIGDSAFNGCEKLTSVTIPLGVTSIGNGAFEGCYDLVNITIPDSVTYIGDFAFVNCLDLTNITIPVGVTSIGNSTFAGCTSLTSIIIPEGVTSIGNGAFYYCEKLTSVTIPSSVTHIGEYAFDQCNMLKSAIFENASGWYYGETLVATEYLSDPSVAAILIINYYLYSWYR